MARLSRSLLLCLLLVAVLLLTAPVTAQDTFPPANIVNDEGEGGVAVLVGEVPYSVGFFATFGGDNMLVMLRDASAYVDRNFDPSYELPLESQFMGWITSDPMVSPFSYRVNLPIVPPGEYRDVDNDTEADTGVVVMDVSVILDTWGNAYNDVREIGTGFSSLRSTTDFDLRYEYIGGKYIVYAPDDAQGFPGGFGDDGLIFTEDDPIVAIPAGYTVVDTDVDPFVFDRAFEAQVDLIEADQSLVPADYSDLTYTEAFDALVDQMRREYAFTEYKGIDWDAIHTELRPLFEAAEARSDSVAFQLAIRELTLRVPDGHVGAGLPAANDLFFEQFGSGIGMAIRELDDGRVIVTFLTENGPAEAAGIEVGAELTEIDGIPIAEVIDSIVPFEGPFSTEHVRRYQQLRYAVRFPVNSRVEVTYRNPDDAATTTDALFSVEEFESYLATALDNDRRPASALPVEFEVLPEGIGYVRINTFSRAPVLMLRLWEEMIDTLNRQQIPALIIDMRQNSGGFNLYNPMASYFFDEELVVGNRAQYYDGLDDFYADPLALETLILPPDGTIYRGPIAVLVGPNCASACEFFSYMMTLEDRAAIIGQYPTAGLGGGITPVRLPDGISFQFTNSRALNAEGGIRFEGIGIVPTERVPITEETLFYDGDVVLDSALDYLSAPQNVAVLDAGAISIGDTVEGEIQRGVRYRYVLDVSADTTLDFVITDEAGTTLRIYVNNETEPRITSNQNDLLDIPVSGGLRLIFEIGGINDITAGAYTFTVRESGTAAAVDVTTVDAGGVAVGDTIFGDLEAGTRLRYTLVPEADGTIDIILSDASGELDTYLRLYDADGNLIAENDDIETGVRVNSELLNVAVTSGEALTIEVGGFDDAAAGEFILKVRVAGG